MNVGPNISSNSDAANVFLETKKIIGSVPCIQIFVQSNNYSITDSEIEFYKKQVGTKIFVHSTYNVSLNRYFPTIRSFQEQYQICANMGVVGFIVHLPRLEINITLDVIKKLFNGTTMDSFKTHPIVYFEHPVSKQFSDPEEFCKFYYDIRQVLPEWVTPGICIDTCHMYASGVKVATGRHVKQYLEIVSNYGQISEILIHLNDSKFVFNSMIDRHADIGTNIWTKEESGIKYLLQTGYCCILELRDYKKNLLKCQEIMKSS